MSRWFRHYAGMMRDDKLVRVAVASKQPVERVVWVWGAILESAAEVNDAGRYDFDAAEAAYFLRADESDLAAILAALAATGRLAESRVVHWRDRQFDSDRSASRQAAYRERRRQSGSDGDGEKTSPSHAGIVTLDKSDVSVTSLSRHGDAPETETETETETEKNNNHPSGGPPANETDVARQAQEIYNAAAGDVGWPQVQRMTAPRRAAVNARLRECGGIAGWQAAIDKAKVSSFLTGRNDTGWRADFDFFCQAKSFTKLMEGSYDDRTPRENPKLNGHDVQLRSIARVVAKRVGLDSGPAGADDRPQHDAGPPASLAAAADDLEIPAFMRRY